METKTKFYVVYSVIGFGEQRAGPYKNEQEAEKQLRDIRGYEGVYSAYLLSETS